MNAMTKFTMASQRANRVRTFVTIMGVALAAALLTAILTSYTSLCDFLYRAEAAISGNWMVEVESDDSDRLHEGLLSAESDPAVTGITVLREVGFGELTQEQRQKLGEYQPIVSVDGDLTSMLGLNASEGRLPEKAGEIMLYKGWKVFEGASVGDEITFQVGERIAVEPELADVDVQATDEASEDADLDGVTLDEDGASSMAEDRNGAVTTFAAGSRLSTSIAYLDSESSDIGLDEELVDKVERTYTIVGFYDRASYAMSCSTGTLALTVGSPTTTDFASVFMTMDGVENAQGVKDLAEELFPSDNVVLHTAMLRFMGIGDNMSIWDTFYGLVIILAAVIIFASVSLIFNAFAISVAERTSQFGLLSSVGATRGQIRRAVILESLIVAVMGIPLGILIGIGGCAATFHFLGPAIADIAGNGVVPFELSVNGWMLLAVVVLTLITVLVSVWIPATRASRINIIDSLRSVNGSRISEKGARLASNATDTSKLWKARGSMSRLFGVGGKLAVIDRKRGSAKGRTAALSLALAIVLLMTAGSLNSFLGTLVDAATGDYTNSGEVTVTAQMDSERLELTPPVTAEDMLDAQNASFVKEADIFAGEYEYLSATENAQSRGYMLYNNTPVIFPEHMAGEGFKDDTSLFGGKMSDGDYLSMTYIDYVDDASFDEYARSLGLDPADYHDPSNPRAIGISNTFGNSGSAYQLIDVLKDTGKVKLIGGATYLDRYPVFIEIGVEEAREGASAAPIPVPDPRYDDSLTSKGLTMNDISYIELELEVAAITEEVPSIVGGRGSYPSLIVPMSLADSNSLGLDNMVFKSAFDSIDGDHAALAEALSTRGGEFFHDSSDVEPAFFSYNDTVAEMDSNQMLATIVNVFCLLFTVILALIAMANVFNTITNSLILRRREFAVMRSIGLSNKQFRRMIMDECMSFGIAGLIPGMVVSVGVSYLMYMAIGQSMSGMPFALPWAYVALAIAMTAVAMGASVAYGMHRCKADNVVEALRADGI